MTDDEHDLSDRDIEWLITIDHVDKAIQELARDWPGRWERQQLRVMLKRRLRRLIAKLQD